MFKIKMNHNLDVVVLKSAKVFDTEEISGKGEKRKRGQGRRGVLYLVSYSAANFSSLGFKYTHFLHQEAILQTENKNKKHQDKKTKNNTAREVF